MLRREFFKLSLAATAFSKAEFAFAQTKRPIVERLADAKKEALKQIDEGMIMGAVFGIGGTEEVVACGTQCRQPEVRPMSPDSRFDLASVGKTFTACCCAHLIADGKLNPDAPFTKYIPEHALGKKCDITVRDLSMHVSGFNNSKPYLSKDKSVFLREVYAKMPVRARLKKFEYSCYNLILLGKIVERISGMRLDEFARKRIWEPLGMSHTQWDAPGAGENEVEHFFPNRPAGSHNDPVCFAVNEPLGNGSCFSTCGDMKLFVDDIANRRLFSKEYYDIFATCRYETKDVRRSFGWDMSSKYRAKCLSDKTIYHSGWTGQTICADIENKFSAVVLTSRTGDKPKATEGRVGIIEKLFA